MKFAIFFALIVAVAFSAPLSAYEENKMIKFAYDTQEDSPLSFYVEGSINPRNDEQNKIQAFLKLANKYIPILESLGSSNNELKWERYWRVQFAGVNLDVFAYFQLIVGWKVNPGGYTTDRFDVTYTPFVWGGTYGSINGTTWPAIGSTDAGLQYVYSYAPISVQLYKQGKICFQGTYVIEPVMFRNHLFAALNECHDEILTDLIDGTSWPNWRCNFTAPVNITVWDINFTNRMAGDFIPLTCFEF